MKNLFLLLSLKSVRRKLRIGENQIFAKRKATKEQANNSKEILQVVEKFNGELCHSHVQSQTEERIQATGTSVENKGESKKAFNNMKDEKLLGKT